MRGVLCRELLGRHDDIAEARVILGHAQNGAGTLMSVLGEAGVGKSRLAREVVAIARAQGFHVLFGRAVRARTPVPFRPLAEALLSHFRHHGPPEAAQLAPFRAVLGRLVPEWHSSDAPVGEPILVLAEAVVRLLRVVAAGAGCLLVLEDLQWADPESLAVVEYLADAVCTELIVVLCTVRSEEPSPRAAWYTSWRRPGRRRCSPRPASATRTWNGWLRPASTPRRPRRRRSVS